MEDLPIKVPILTEPIQMFELDSCNLKKGFRKARVSIPSQFGHVAVTFSRMIARFNAPSKQNRDGII